MDRAARVPVRAMVRRLRRKLGEHADDPTYIFAEPRVGYRMAGTPPTQVNATSRRIEQIRLDLTDAVRFTTEYSVHTMRQAHRAPTDRPNPVGAG